ncbi:F-box protein-like protein isoform X1 [Tanacetum coccineum]
MVVAATPNAPPFADPDPNAPLWCRGGLLNHRSKHPFGAEPRRLCRGEDRGDDGDDVGLVTEMRRWEGAGDMEVEMTRSGDDESGGGRLWLPELFAGKLFRQRRRKMIERKMEAGSSSELSLGLEVATGDDGISSRNLFTDNELPSSVHTVVSDDNLLTEILLRLPILALLFFKSVSKRWLALIKHINSTLRRTKNPNLDPPTGLFIQRLESPSLYDFVSLDSRIPSGIYPLPLNFNFRLNSQTRFFIVDSCNGLLLCEGVNQDNMIMTNIRCVYNPSVNLFKMLPKCHDPSLTRVKPFMKIAFDPRKSTHYKVVLIGDGFNKIEIYSSKAGSWSVCRIPNISHMYFQLGIYWNNAIHWLDNEPLHFKLDILNEHPIITKIQLPVTVDKKMPLSRKLFESRGCLLLLGVDHNNSQQFNIYEMSNVSSEWSVKYNLNFDDNIILWPMKFSYDVWCIVLGEREEDSFIVMELDKKIVEYKIMSKNFLELYDMGPGHALGGFQFFASFAGPEHEGTCSRESDTLSSVMDSLVCNAGYETLMIN